MSSQAKSSPNIRRLNPFAIRAARLTHLSVIISVTSIDSPPADKFDIAATTTSSPWAGIVCRSNPSSARV